MIYKFPSGAVKRHFDVGTTKIDTMSLWRCVQMVYI